MNTAGDSVAKPDGGEMAEKFAAGKVYEVKLTNGIEFKGIVLAYDSDPNFAIFEEGTKPKPGKLKNTRTVNASSITELKYISKVKDPLAAKKPSIDLNELIDKETKAIRKIEGLGVGVTAEAQDIFDALAKTFPVKWDNSDILVMKEVRICSPYGSDCVSGGSRPAINRVKRVLDFEKKKLQLIGTEGN